MPADDQPTIWEKTLKAVHACAAAGHRPGSILLGEADHAEMLELCAAVATLPDEKMRGVTSAPPSFLGLPFAPWPGYARGVRVLPVEQTDAPVVEATNP